ncbi:MAG: hypothetical protein EU542_07200 [Promethearchaeota archaeon]|nr:MAG: hypothetical protein EU542_07200 [Candidatus Lokiarchaeota archaeon]
MPENSTRKKEPEKNEIQDPSKEEEENKLNTGEDKENHSKPIILKAEAYKTIILYASRYANQSIPPKEWKEIYGILIGYSDDEFVHVERAEPLTFGHSTDVQLDQRHYIFIADIENKLYEEGKGYYVVGWFHSHPGLGLFFSFTDLRNQLGFQQANQDFCGLVFDHTLLGKKKLEKMEGSEHVITKYDTGFEIYRITDTNMDIDDPVFDSNYHKVDYVVDGLNKFFFANVLSELSALVSAGKPLQSAYGEEGKKKMAHSGKTHQEYLDVGKKNLVNIPMSDDIIFDVDDFFYGEISKKTKKQSKLREDAERSIYEGNLAFKQKDAFMGVEKYRKGIKIYKTLQDHDKVLELLRNLSDYCISTNHEVLAEEFIKDLFDLAQKYDHLFYEAEANYLNGYSSLKKGEPENLEQPLKKIQEASITFERVGDFAGAGKCYHKIGMVYQTRLNKPFNACLFYNQAIKSYKQALVKGNPLRKELWNKPEVLSKKIIDIKDTVEELISNIENLDERRKIRSDLDSFELNL